MTEGSLTDIGEAADKVCEGRADWTEECRGGRACSVASVTSDSSGPHGLQSTRLLCQWDSPGKNTGVGCHALQGIFPTQGSNLHLPVSPALWANSLLSQPSGNSPDNTVKPQTTNRNKYCTQVWKFLSYYCSIQF